MNNGENKREHLNLIQDVIKRMGGNSFLLRGWSITLVIAVATISATVKTPYLLFLSLFLTLIFWTLDAFYLSQERAYICLYNDVRKKDEGEIDFNLNAKNHLTGRNCWFRSLFSPVFVVFYGSTLLLLLIVLAQFIGMNISFYFK